MDGKLLLDTGGLVSLLDRRQSRHAEFVEFFETWEGAAVSTEAALRRARQLLVQYRDLPMDDADATLVVLAEELGTDLVLHHRPSRLQRRSDRGPKAVSHRAEMSATAHQNRPMPRAPRLSSTTSPSPAPARA